MKVAYFEGQERANRITLDWITGQQCIDTGLNWLMIETNSITDVELPGSSKKGQRFFATKIKFSQSHRTLPFC